MATTLHIASPVSNPPPHTATIEDMLHFAPLRTLDEEALSVLLPVAHLETLGDGENLFQFGDIDDSEYFLLSGRLRLMAGDGKAHQVEAGNIVAQQPLARLRPRQYSGIVDGEASVLVVDRQLLSRLLEQMRQRIQTRYGVEELQGRELGTESEELLLFRAFRDDVREFRFHLPELPPAVAEIRQLVRMGSCDSAEVAKVAGTVPALERYLLHAANSPLFSPREPCAHCITAVERLGLPQVSDLVLAFVPSLLRGRSGVDWESCWLHSLGVAAGGWWLADRTGLVPPHQALVLGLLHNAGMPAAIHYLKTQTLMPLEDEEKQQLLPLLCRDITRLLFSLWDVDELYSQCLPVLYDWQLAGKATRPGLCDVMQTARYLQLQADRNESLPTHEHIAGLVRLALYEQRLVNPRATRLDIARILSRLQRIFLA